MFPTLPLISESQPFVLLDDARALGAADARLFRNPVEIIRADSLDAVLPELDRLDLALSHGALAAGYIAYGASAAFHPRWQDTAEQATKANGPLLWFGVFDQMERVPAADVPGLLPDPAGAWLGLVQPHIDVDEYRAALDCVIDYIRAGDIYQANLTFAARVAVHGHPLAAYAALRRAAQAGYGGVVYTGDQWHVSASPELFFSLRDDHLITKPMKGTARRGSDAVSDAAAVAALQSDPKQRAENLMIVDLLRNDVSRIAMPGSVAVPDLFRVETYPTIHQMISVVEAQRRPKVTFAETIHALFPCGSITGAPKYRAMEIIGEVEAQPRALYTGSIGYAQGQDEAAFNVAIRTLSFSASDDPAGPHIAQLGLGSGIVADSRLWPEWDECLAKGDFVRRAASYTIGNFDLIETMAFDPAVGIARLDLHLARMATSAAAFDFSFDRHRIRNELQAATFRRRDAAKIRLLLSVRGSVAIEVQELPETPATSVPVSLCPLPVEASDIRLRHKTSNRTFYDDARLAAPGSWDVVFHLPDGQLTEGSFTCLFVERDGMLLTPPASLGLLPGVLRADLIAQGKAVEAALTADDLTGGFWLGNSLRGLVRADLIDKK